MGRRPIGVRAMTGSDRRRKFEKTHYHDPIVDYQTTIAEQRLRIRKLEDQLSNLVAIQDTEPKQTTFDVDLLGKRVDELTTENYQLRQDVKALKKRLNED
jgi:hypothetical protein